MDLWIRSQDKKTLKKVEDLYINPIISIGCIVSQDDLYWIADKGTKLGGYKTEERALEVLDKIQSCIQTNDLFQLYSHMGNFPHKFNKEYNYVSVFQMPEE